MKLPELSRCSAVAMGVAAAALSLSVAGGASPAPAGDAERAAERVFADVYGKEAEALSKAKPAEKVKFAKKLAEAVTGVKDNPALARVLRQKAVEFAMADASGHAVALELRRAQAADAELRPTVLPEFVVLLEKVIKTETKPPARRKLADELLAGYRDLTAERMQAEDIAGALALIAKAKSACRSHLPAADSRDMTKDLEAEEKDLRKRQQLLDAAAKELAVLEKAPRDPKANLALGLIRLHLGKEDAAAPNLQACEDQALRKLGDLLAKNPPASDLELGDAYRAAADSVPAEKNLLLGLARTRYETFLEKEPNHAGAARVKLLIGQLPEATGSSVPGQGHAVQFVRTDEAFVKKFNELSSGPKLQLELKDRFAREAAIRAVPDNSALGDIPANRFEIVERPGKNQFRYIGFAWKKIGGKGIAIQLADKGVWGDSGKRLLRYGRGETGQWPVVKLGDSAPVNWSFEIRDLFADFGPMVLSGIAFNAIDGEAALFGPVFLGKTREELERLRPRKSP